MNQHLLFLSFKFSLSLLLHCAHLVKWLFNIIFSIPGWWYILLYFSEKTRKESAVLCEYIFIYIWILMFLYKSVWIIHINKSISDSIWERAQEHLLSMCARFLQRNVSFVLLELERTITTLYTWIFSCACKKVAPRKGTA